MSVEAYFCLDFFGPFFIKEKRTNKESYPGLRREDLAFGKQLKKYDCSINSNDFYSQKSLTGQHRCVICDKPSLAEASLRETLRVAQRLRAGRPAYAEATRKAGDLASGELTSCS